MLLSCDDERHSILSVIFVSSRAIVATCVLAIGHAQTWGLSAPGAFWALYPGLPRGSSDSRFWILPQGASFSCTALSPEWASTVSGIATFLDTTCSLGEPRPSLNESCVLADRALHAVSHDYRSRDNVCPFERDSARWSYRAFPLGVRDETERDENQSTTRSQYPRYRRSGPALLRGWYESSQSTPDWHQV